MVSTALVASGGLIAWVGLPTMFASAGAGAGTCWQSFCSNYPPAPAGNWQSKQVSYDSKGKLRYTEDAGHNRIPDFSYAGYHSGAQDLPTVPVVARLSAVAGDNTQRIQDALDRIGNRTMDASGHRGALLLAPGKYEIAGTVRIRQDGVVLRGSGDGTNEANSTILWATGNAPNHRTVVVVGSGNGNPWTLGAKVEITTPFVPVNSMSFEVANASTFRIGQRVMVTHPSSQKWIDAVDGGGVVNEPGWTAGTMDLQWVRTVTKIAGQRLYLDAPIYDHLDRALTVSNVAPVTRSNIVTESGVESLRVDIATAGGDDEAHAWSAIGVVGAENSWVQNVSTRYFGYAGVVTGGALRITVRNANATEPVARRVGGNMYNFAAGGFSQLVLFTGCHAGQGRHAFISNGATTVSGVVWHRCTMEGGTAEGHRRWSQALLFDNIREIGTADTEADLMNRGDMGTAHGWSAVHSVIWNFNKVMVVQKPPTGQNYAISTVGVRRGQPYFPGPWGSIEINSGQLMPLSLYEAQVVDRFKN